jgi:hypothetical protein
MFFTFLSLKRWATSLWSSAICHHSRLKTAPYLNPWPSKTTVGSNTAISILLKLWSSGKLYLLKMPRGKRSTVSVSSFLTSTLRTRFVSKGEWEQLMRIIVIRGKRGSLSLIQDTWIRMRRDLLCYLYLSWVIFIIAIKFCLGVCYLYL